MDMLDSRALGPTDCYAQRFMRPGTYAYALVPARGGTLNDDRPFTIEVTGEKPGKEATQHTVLVTRRGGTFRPDPEKLAIALGVHLRGGDVN